MTVTVRSIDVENEATVESVRSNRFTSVPFELYIIRYLLVVGRKNYEIKKNYMVRLNLRKRNSLLIANTFHCVIQSKSLFHLMPENFFKFVATMSNLSMLEMLRFAFVSTLNIVGNAVKKFFIL